MQTRCLKTSSSTGHRTNAEEIQYVNEHGQLNYIANFTKGLPHDSAYCEVQPNAYQQLLRALNSNSPTDFEQIELATPADGRKLVNPQAGNANLSPSICASMYLMPPAPRIDSAEGAAEMGELYWMAILRDTPFSKFPHSSRVRRAAHSLSTEFPGYFKLVNARQITPQTLFRGVTLGDQVGPYISQFLVRGTSSNSTHFKDGIISYGSQTIDQKQYPPKSNMDFMTNYSEFLAIQNGKNTMGGEEFENTVRFINTPRDLAHYVHFDQLYQAYLNACLILFDMKVPLDHGNPYISSITQSGFAGFGAPHVLCLIPEAALRALKASWYQKWYVHRRFRPEAFGGLVHNTLLNQREYPIHEDLIRSSVIQEIFQYNSQQIESFLLPQAYSEGSPMHPSYGAGHATVAGACVTILKAFFNEAFPFETVLVPNSDGTELEEYTPAQQYSDYFEDPPIDGNDVSHPPFNNKVPVLTVGGELDKLAGNISIGRNMAGVHYLSDYTEAITLGEAVAIDMLKEQKAMYNEKHFFSFTGFDGTGVVV